MQFHFFEEFPTEDNLARTRDIAFPCTLFLAAHSGTEFLHLADRLAYWNPRIEPAYWPILRESYWISPFAFPHELAELGEELSQLATFWTGRVLFDMELPLLHPRLFVSHALSFSESKKQIYALCHDAVEKGFTVCTAEYPMPYRWSGRLQEVLGIAFRSDAFPHIKIPMFYTSISPRWRWASWLGQRMLSPQPHKERNMMIGVGTIAEGIFGNEPILSPESLSRDLAFLRQFGVEDVVIFRLGGLSDAYHEVIADHRYMPS